MGAKISGHGTDIILMRVLPALVGLSTGLLQIVLRRVRLPLPAMTGGRLTLKQARPRHLDALIDVLRLTGVDVSELGDDLRSQPLAGRWQSIYVLIRFLDSPLICKHSSWR